MPKVRRAKPKPATDKLNPNSLTRLLIAIRQDFTGEDMKKFAGTLTKSGNRYKRTTVNQKHIADIEENKRSIRYIDIEKYARVLGIPSGLLLLFSRMMANDDEIREHNAGMARVLVEIFKDITAETWFERPRIEKGKDAREINLEELERWRDVWNASGVASDEPSLPLKPTSKSAS